MSTAQWAAQSLVSGLWQNLLFLAEALPEELPLPLKPPKLILPDFGQWNMMTVIWAEQVHFKSIRKSTFLMQEDGSSKWNARHDAWSVDFQEGTNLGTHCAENCTSLSFKWKMHRKEANKANVKEYQRMGLSTAFNFASAAHGDLVGPQEKFAFGWSNVCASVCWQHLELGRSCRFVQLEAKQHKTTFSLHLHFKCFFDPPLLISFDLISFEPCKPRKLFLLVPVLYLLVLGRLHFSLRTANTKLIWAWIRTCCSELLSKHRQAFSNRLPAC